MPYISQNYSVETGEHGLMVITIVGRATADLAAAIEAGVCRRYRLVPYPAATGAVLKVLDGSSAVAQTVTVPNTSRSYTCVKVRGEANPLAPTQAAGMPYAGQAIVRFVLRYQQVGRLAR
jgi:hypothetical protein